MPYVAQTSGPTPPVDNVGLPRRAEGGPPSSAGATAIDGFAAAGDNFKTVGPWRVLSGNGWHRWQLRAKAAELAASRCSKDHITAARQLREQKARGSEHPSRGGDADE